MSVNVARAIGLYLAWLGFISTILLVAIGDVLPWRLGFIRPENAFACLVEAELFFVLVIWPFFIPRLLQPRTPGKAVRLGESHLLVLQMAVLFVVAMPVALLSQNLADVGVVEFFRGHLLVAVMGCFVAILHAAAGERHVTFAPWYFLGLFGAAALLPFAHYLSLEYAGASLSWLSAVSPFWSATRLDGEIPMASSAIFGLGALAILVRGTVRRTPAATGTGPRAVE